jgi:hypothetical protein
MYLVFFAPSIISSVSLVYKCLSLPKANNITPEDSTIARQEENIKHNKHIALTMTK